MVCDAVHGLASERQAIERVATDLGVPFRGFWLDAPEAVLEARVAARTGDASDADVAVVRRQRELVDGAAVTWRRVRADRDLGEMADESRRRWSLGRRRSRPSGGTTFGRNADGAGGRGGPPVPRDGAPRSVACVSSNMATTAPRSGVGSRPARLSATSGTGSTAASTAR